MTRLGMTWLCAAALIAAVACVACGDDDEDSAGALDSGSKPATKDSGAPPAKDSGATDSDAGDAHAPQLKQADRSKLTDVGTDGDLDYEAPELWVCRPDIDPNECHRNIDATELLADGSTKVVEHERTQRPEYDCFYVYPTVLLGTTPNMTDFSQEGVDLVLDPLVSQAARFSRVCEVYAPFYRQNGLNPAGGGDGGVGLAAGADSNLALGDVRAAFAYYLEHFNNGRKFVLIGHSQGSFMLTSMIQADVDDEPVVRDQMISALLLGGDVRVPPGELVGGSFKNIPLCSKPAETGCVIAYNSFAKEAPPPASAVFGRQNATGQVACTEPAALAGNDGAYKGSYLPTHVNNAAFAADVMIPDTIKTPFLLYRDLFRGKCVNQDGFSYLEISYEPEDGDMRDIPPYRSATLDSIGFGLHLVDFNLPMDDLIEIVTQQAAAAL